MRERREDIEVDYEEDYTQSLKSKVDMAKELQIRCLDREGGHRCPEWTVNEARIKRVSMEQSWTVLLQREEMIEGVENCNLC